MPVDGVKQWFGVGHFLYEPQTPRGNYSEPDIWAGGFFTVGQSDWASETIRLVLAISPNSHYVKRGDKFVGEDSVLFS